MRAFLAFLALSSGCAHLCGELKNPTVKLKEATLDFYNVEGCRSTIEMDVDVTAEAPLVVHRARMAFVDGGGERADEEATEEVSVAENVGNWGWIGFGLEGGENTKPTFKLEAGERKTLHLRLPRFPDVEAGEVLYLDLGSALWSKDKRLKVPRLPMRFVRR